MPSLSKNQINISFPKLTFGSWKVLKKEKNVEENDFLIFSYKIEYNIKNKK